MLPAIELRIQNIIKALREVVLPAIPANDRLAIDQAELVIGHLRMIAVQWQYALRFEADSLDHLLSLANRIESTDGIPIAESARMRLADLHKQYRHFDRSNEALMAEAIRQVGSCIDDVILGEGTEGTITPQLMAAVLKYGALQAHRERTWYQDNMLDPDRADLPSVNSMFAKSA